MIFFGMVTTARSRRYTLPALDSFLRHTALSPDDRVLLMDNDGDFELPLSFARVELVRRAQPASFAANVNYVLRLAAEHKADTVFLNNDMIFTPGWLTPLTVTDNAILTPMCNQHAAYRRDGLELRTTMDWEDYGGREMALEAMAETHRADPRFRGQLWRPQKISFYCFRLPYPVHAAIGLFDEDFGPGGGEDVDYRLRALMAGFDIAVAMESYVLHFMGKSTWDSGESERETRARDAVYVQHFRNKWGEVLVRLFLLGDDPAKYTFLPGVDDMMRSGDYRGVVALCLANR